jgi:acetyl esterase/lipase
VKQLTVSVTAMIVAFAFSALAATDAHAAPTTETLPASNSAAAGELIVVHGGAWWLVGPGAVETARPAAQRFASQGWDVQLIDYAAGPDSLPDVVAFYDSERERLGPSYPICAYGESAGGQLALMLAGERPELNCVIAAAAPTDLTAQHGFVAEALNKLFPDDPSRLVDWSPINADIRQPTLLAAALNDQVIPPSDTRLMVSELPSAKLVLLHHGSSQWVHSDVSNRDLRKLNRAECLFLAQIT